MAPHGLPGDNERASGSHGPTRHRRQLDIALGIVGAIVGGFLFNIFGADGVTGLNLYSMVVAVIGSVVVLVAYHAITGRRSWLALRYGPFIAHGVVGGSLLLLALILFTLALVRRRPKVAPPPRLQSAQPAALIGTLRQGGYDEVTSIGEQAFKVAISTLRGGNRTALFGTLALAAVVGLIVGRRL